MLGDVGTFLKNFRTLDNYFIFCLYCIHWNDKCNTWKLKNWIIHCAHQSHSFSALTTFFFCSRQKQSVPFQTKIANVSKMRTSQVCYCIINFFFGLYSTGFVSEISLQMKATIYQASICLDRNSKCVRVTVTNSCLMVICLHSSSMEWISWAPASCGISGSSS